MPLAAECRLRVMYAGKYPKQILKPPGMLGTRAQLMSMHLWYSEAQWHFFVKGFSVRQGRALNSEVCGLMPLEVGHLEENLRHSDEEQRG